MPLPPKQDHRIDRAEAAALTRRHREAAGSRADRGGFFHREAVQQLLAQQGCEGLRYYYARKEDGGQALVLLGVDADGNDMTEGTILEWTMPCPPYCPEPGDLNP